jgi:hypothetical protein
MMSVLCASCVQAHEKHGGVQLPAAIAGVLKDNQKEGLRFLWESLGGAQPTGAVLAHNMGLGKTLTTIAFLQSYLIHHPQVWLGPYARPLCNASSRRRSCLGVFVGATLDPSEEGHGTLPS